MDRVHVERTSGSNGSGIPPAITLEASWIEGKPVDFFVLNGVDIHEVRELHHKIDNLEAGRGSALPLLRASQAIFARLLA